MRMRAGWLAISLGLACGVLARESTQKREVRTPPSNEDAPVASWVGVEGPIQAQAVQGEFRSADVEDAGAENRVFFVPFGERSPSMEEMRARLADPEQRKAMRAEQRSNLEQTYPDVDEALNLDSTTHEALMQLLTDHSMESMDRMVSVHQHKALPSMHDMAGLENRKLDQLREILGEEGLERYREYTTTVYERRQVREVDAYLGVANKLSPEQKARLVTLFQEKNKMGLPLPSVARMPNRLRLPDMNSPTFQEDMQRKMQRDSELATIESNEEILRLRETANRWMAERAAEFLGPAQIAAIARVNEAEQARQRKWIVEARTKAGLDPAIPERKEQEEEPLPSRKPASGEVTLDLVVRVNGGEDVHVVHTGRNGEPLKFKASEDLFVEAEWTLFDDNWFDVRLAYFEEGPNGRRRLQGGSGFGTMGRTSGEPAPGDNGTWARTSSSTIVMGRKAYSVEVGASVQAR